MAARGSPVRGVPVRDALDSAVIALRGAGVERPRLDAEVLLAWALGVDRATLVTESERPVEGAAVRAFQDAVRRRSGAREPVAYITGVKPFRHLELHVDRRVLIPRPETEDLVAVALELPAGGRVHDLGTGSGAVALALKHERPDLIVSGSDASADAVAVARANAARLALDVRFDVASWLHGVGERLDALLSNPPYVAEHDRGGLAPELRHEPAAALFAGADGLDGFRAIARALRSQAEAQRPARVALEVGAGQAQDVARLLRGAGMSDCAVRRDLAGIERLVVAWRP